MLLFGPDVGFSNGSTSPVHKGLKETRYGWPDRPW